MALDGDAWEAVLAVRDAARPTARNHRQAMLDYFFELRGDRCGRDDPAILAGLGSMDGFRVVVVAHQKGGDAESRAACNFGMPQPWGYRKARRVFALAARLGVPLLCLVDTPGAFPGKEAEAEAGRMEEKG